MILQLSLGQLVLLRYKNRYLGYLCTYEGVEPAGLRNRYGAGSWCLVFRYGSNQDDTFCSRPDGSFGDGTQAVPLTDAEEAVYRLSGAGPAFEGTV